MNAPTLPPTTPATTVLRPSVSVIAVDLDAEVNKRACGRITMWSLNGDVTVEALTKALEIVESKALPPEAPSALVALNRAVETVAKAMGHLDKHHLGRGEWAIVGKGETEKGLDGVQRKLVYDIECTAKIVREGDTERLEIAGKGEDQIRAAYDIAKATLAPADIGTWLCDKLTQLGALALRDRGGVYFVPQPQVWKWDRIIAALKKCSKHVVNIIPAMRSQDAVDAILTSLTADTRAECDKIVADIGDGELGTKALATREKTAADLLARVSQYEELLGTKLDALRAVLDETKNAVAVAALATASDS